MGKKGKKSFVFNCEWQEVLMEYPAEVRLEVYDAIIEYVASGKLSELKPLAKMAFSFIKKEIDYNQSKYEEVSAKRSEAGKAGANAANASKSQQMPANAANASKSQQKQQMPANAANASIYDNDNEKESSTGVEDKKKPPSPPPTLEGEIAALKGDMCWLDQLQVLHGMDTGTLKVRLDEFRLHCAADGKERHESLADAKQHFNNWLRVTAEKQRSYGNRNRNACTSKQEANDYALQQYLADREALDKGVYDTAEEPF